MASDATNVPLLHKRIGNLVRDLEKARKERDEAQKRYEGLDKMVRDEIVELGLSKKPDLEGKTYDGVVPGDVKAAGLVMRQEGMTEGVKMTFVVLHKVVKRYCLCDGKPESEGCCTVCKVAFVMVRMATEGVKPEAKEE